MRASRYETLRWDEQKQIIFNGYNFTDMYRASLMITLIIRREFVLSSHL